MKFKVLLVDDNAEVRNLLRLTLASEPYELQEASNGAAALELMRAWKPDIVLLDIMMPGEKDGLQVSREIRQEPALQDVYIAMLTARGQQQDIHEGMKAGANAYIIKPFSPIELRKQMQRIAEVISQRGSENT